MKIIDIKPQGSLVRVFLAPSVISPEGINPVIEKFEYFLAELSTRFGTNIFLKRVFRSGDYYAIIAIESSEYDKVVRIASEVERRARMAGSRLKRMLSKAIEFF